MHFLKILTLTIIVICMVTALVYGVIDIAKLAIDLGSNGVQQIEEVHEGQEGIVQGTVDTVVPMDIWREHLANITFSGLSLSVLFMGWKSIMEYCKEHEI